MGTEPVRSVLETWFLVPAFIEGDGRGKGGKGSWEKEWR